MSTLGPDLRMKSSASSKMGVSTSLNPKVLAVCLSLFSKNLRLSISSGRKSLVPRGH